MILHSAIKAAKDLVEILDAVRPTQYLLSGKRCPTCRQVVETTQKLIPLGPEIATCEKCNSKWYDGMCAKWHGWWLV